MKEIIKEAIKNKKYLIIKKDKELKACNWDQLTYFKSKGFEYVGTVEELAAEYKIS